MHQTVKKRPYVSPKRQAKAAETRARTLAAASQMFLDAGYARTSTAAIAKAARTSEANVFAMFGSKAELLLQVVFEHVRNDPTFSMGDPARWQGLIGKDRRALATAELTALVRRAHDRSWRIRTVAAAAAPDDDTVREAVARGAQRRHDDCLWFVLEVLAVPEDRLEETADALWVLTNVENYRLLVLDRGWAPERYEQWLAAMISAALEDQENAH
ncbi:helix-turn-helix domain-containing protein [Arthrobacter sp. NQ7]|uniref:TetR/AcrR family transcriptional regulator n=1 Tax=Arthrobacter sp. NQ7 TaxID=3032303 RepID=UPI00240FEFAB|nr:TetR/AcrR family transcriptional regulator [Arthrobacter sp. NQ7]MDJ0459666.1 helix-turn-helix domain-containing protein [Arthrobacter sp. NQ7]